MFSTWRRKAWKKWAFRRQGAVWDAARSEQAVRLRREEARQARSRPNKNAAAHIDNNLLTAINGGNAFMGPPALPALFAVPAPNTPPDLPLRSSTEICGNFLGFPASNAHPNLPLTGITQDNRCRQSAHHPGRTGRKSRGPGRGPTAFAH
jgi:hypothetical protein